MAIEIDEDARSIRYEIMHLGLNAWSVIAVPDVGDDYLFKPLLQFTSEGEAKKVRSALTKAYRDGAEMRLRKIRDKI